MLMLRNLVTSLIEHEQIKTTLPKARDTARLADKLITLGKKGDLPAARRAQGFLLKPTLVPKVFGALAHRYAHRPGGYTRIHKYGNRQGDNAPHAVLELVDNPRDLRFNMTARAIGWELMGSSLAKGTKSAVESDVTNVEAVIRQEKDKEDKLGYLRHGIGGRLRRITQENVKKVLKYRGQSGVKQLSEQAQQYIGQLAAEPLAHVGVRRYVEDEEKRGDHLSTYESMKKERTIAGSRQPATDASVYSLSRGVLFRRRKAGLGLPGAGWFQRERGKLRSQEGVSVS